MFVDAEQGVLRGQLTFDPHRTRRAQAERPAELEQRVLSLVSQSVLLEVDGARCATRMELRELWVPAGATLGDIVMLRCPLRSASRELRVFAAETIGALVVSIQTLGPAGEPHTRSALVAGGRWSPPYRFAENTPGWIEGGAAIFEPDGREARRTVGLHPAGPNAALGARSTSATKTPRGALASALSVALRHFELAVQRAPLVSLPLSFAAVFLIAAWAIRRIRG